MSKFITIRVHKMVERPFDGWTDGNKVIIDMMNVGQIDRPNDIPVLYFNIDETLKFIETSSPFSTFFIFASIREVYKLIETYPARDIRLVLK